MNGHPGGEEHTRNMLALSAMPVGSRILDMGAGDGTGVRLLGSLGYDAVGIDLAPRGEGVASGDMLAAPYPDGSFDGILAQCSFCVSGEISGAIWESHRLLRPGGRLMLSDVCFEDMAPALTNGGFRILRTEDMTPLWREYYIKAVWNGTADCCNVRGKCRYMMYICEKLEFVVANQ